MNSEEIKAILRIGDLSETEEALETELFEIRKAILAKPLLRLTLKSKLTRLDVLAQLAASQDLFTEQQPVPFSYDVVQSDEVLVLWEGYMKAKSRWKIAFTQTQTPAQCAAMLEEGLKMEAAFAAQFEALDWIAEEPVFGTEPDPMLVQNGLKQAAQNGWRTFAELEKNKSQLEKALLLAIKRLSLLPKYL